jgi:hypothetical protein
MTGSGLLVVVVLRTVRSPSAQATASDGTRAHAAACDRAGNRISPFTRAGKRSAG